MLPAPLPSWSSPDERELFFAACGDCQASQAGSPGLGFPRLEPGPASPTQSKENVLFFGSNFRIRSVNDTGKSWISACFSRCSHRPATSSASSAYFRGLQALWTAELRRRPGSGPGAAKRVAKSRVPERAVKLATLEKAERLLRMLSVSPADIQRDGAGCATNQATLPPPARRHLEWMFRLTCSVGNDML